MRLRGLVVGFVLWLVGAIVIRLAGQRLLQPGAVGRTLVLYAVSFVAFAALARVLARHVSIPLLILPTLILDPLSCLFFASVFPNVDPAAAGVFGGWMLISCGGAVVGGWRG